MERNVLNNVKMRMLRKEHLYKAVITDLVLLGVLDKSKAEIVLGYEIPDYITLPENTVAEKTVEKEVKKEKKEKSAKAE